MNFPNAIIIALKKVPGLSESEQEAYDKTAGNLARTISKTSLVLYIDDIVHTRFSQTNEGPNEGKIEASMKNVGLQAEMTLRGNLLGYMSQHMLTNFVHTQKRVSSESKQHTEEDSQKESLKVYIK